MLIKKQGVDTKIKKSVRFLLNKAYEGLPISLISFSFLLKAAYAHLKTLFP